MDWSRVKSILIIALLITNLIIVLFIVIDDVTESQMSTAEQRVLIEKILKDADVDNQIEQAMPIIETMPQLTIAYQMYEMPVFASQFLGKFSEVGGAYQNSQYKMTFNDNTLYIVNLNKSKDEAAHLEQAELTAQGFINRYFGETIDYELLDKRVEEDAVILQYGQKYQNFYIYDTAMNIVVRGDQVVSFQRKWMMIQTSNKAPQSVKTCYRALFSAIDQFAAQAPVTIEAVDLGYRLEKTLLGENVQSGDALPYYRFKLANKKPLFVPALSEKY